MNYTALGGIFTGHELVREAITARAARGVHYVAVCNSGAAAAGAGVHVLKALTRADVGAGEIKHRVAMVTGKGTNAPLVTLFGQYMVSQRLTEESAPIAAFIVSGDRNQAAKDPAQGVTANVVYIESPTTAEAAAWFKKLPAGAALILDGVWRPEDLAYYTQVFGAPVPAPGQRITEPRRKNHCYMWLCPGAALTAPEPDASEAEGFNLDAPPADGDAEPKKRRR